MLLGFWVLLSAAAVPVVVSPAAGESYDARWTGVSEQGIVLEVGGDPRLVELSELRRIERREEAPAASGGVRIGLVDGSRLRAESFLLDGNRAQIQLGGGSELELPLRELRWVRFRPPSGQIDGQWLGLLAEETPADLLVVRRSPEAIDQVRGAVLAVEAEVVRFDLDSQEARAPRERLEGIIFRGPALAERRAAIEVTTRHGSVWKAEALEGADGEGLIRLRRAENAQSIPLEIDQIQSLSFEGNVVYLASQPMVERSYTPHLELPVSAEVATRWLGPRAVGSTDLVLRSRSRAIFRIEEGYRRLALVVAPDPAAIAGDGAVVRVLVDGRQAWEGTVSPSDAPVGIELPIEGARRVAFEVDYGEGGDAGDVIRLRQPRLIR